MVVKKGRFIQREIIAIGEKSSLNRSGPVAKLPAPENSRSCRSESQETRGTTTLKRTGVLGINYQSI